MTNGYMETVTRSTLRFQPPTSDAASEEDDDSGGDDDDDHHGVPCTSVTDPRILALLRAVPTTDFNLLLAAMDLASYERAGSGVAGAAMDRAAGAVSRKRPRGT
jgi:hypothetical protein